MQYILRTYKFQKELDFFQYFYQWSVCKIGIGAQNYNLFGYKFTWYSRIVQINSMQDFIFILLPIFFDCMLPSRISGQMAWILCSFINCQEIIFFFTLNTTFSLYFQLWFIFIDACFVLMILVLSDLVPEPPLDTFVVCKSKEYLEHIQLEDEEERASSRM